MNETFSTSSSEEAARGPAEPTEVQVPVAPVTPMLETLRVAAAALGEPRRCRILQLLLEGPMIVSDLVTETGWKQPLVSHHLAALVKAGLVACHVDGRKHWYGVSPDAPTPLAQLLALFASSHAARAPQRPQAAAPASGPPASGDPSVQRGPSSTESRSAGRSDDARTGDAPTADAARATPPPIATHPPIAAPPEPLASRPQSGSTIPADPSGAPPEQRPDSPRSEPSLETPEGPAASSPSPASGDIEDFLL